MTSPIQVSDHAITRYVERVDPKADYATALAALSSPAVQAAIRFGAQFVRLGTGHRIVVTDGIVKTVLPPGNYRKQVQRIGTAKFGRYAG